MLRTLFFCFAMLVGSTTLHAGDTYQPKAKPVADKVWAIVGPLGQRSAENDGLNANYGFIVTPQGVILIDSGASRLGAEKLAAAVRAVTAQPIRWVINTGSQDHRWLGNAYFAEHGAEVIAMSRTAATQAHYAEQQMNGLKGFLGARLKGTQPRPASHTLEGDEATLTLGGETLVLRYTDAHYPGDAWVWLPRQRVVFTGDLVYVDRLLGVLPWSSVKNGQRAFAALKALDPARLVPGHGRVCDLAQAQRETGDYYDFLVGKIGTAAREMEPMSEVLDRYADLPAFRHLQNYGELHRANMNRAFTEFEAQ
ncbi:glyoxylase-like metal-dependent hydrolase (beta-lactamase superfamily II) [Sulfuritortus calidifontis]|uniref:Glyoxylase-like metal-dependent hydrolase (Beta-lactamase superfamily II) n=1 Tax=Sulfuritortus calidifontis TaxID=1914471 RepID=A0A4R3JY34_9PROT|nr:MBL fold metallo-hydrolase [Sulfuritortus calidifontis]TCS71737.1 glyoxylase-like metal-dependent hydrolase (beta-lactamase superfamily II) [Sulfuritortus calidifontis]